MYHDFECADAGVNGLPVCFCRMGLNTELPKGQTGSVGTSVASAEQVHQHHADLHAQLICTHFSPMRISCLSVFAFIRDIGTATHFVTALSVFVSRTSCLRGWPGCETRCRGAPQCCMTETRVWTV